MTKVVKAYPDLVVVATKSNVPFDSLEELLEKKIVWLENPNDIWDMRDLYADRNLVIFTGWWHSGWKKFGKHLKRKNNAKVVVVVDNNYKATLRQFIGAVYFRLFLKNQFDAAFVPGRDGVKLLKFLGMPQDRIFTGNYGAYEEIFYDTTPITQRDNQFLFVGQLIHRKSVDVMIEAFNQYRKDGGTWDLKILGNGPLEKICRGEGIIHQNFAQPESVSYEMNCSKVLILASREEHWGTVVCEAAACGMALITSQYVGSSNDLVRNYVNGIELQNIQSGELAKAFHFFEGLSDYEMRNMSKVSRGIAKSYDSFAYLMCFKKLTSLV